MALRFLSRAVPTLALGAVSCGLASHDATSSALPTDGLGSFGPFQPIELCRGTARVVAPSQATGAGAAVCVPEGSKAKSCSADSQCEGIERCTCGRCIVRACQGASSCGEGEVCRAKRCTHPCTVDASCPAGERCISGGCARPCSNDAGCHFGEQCDALDGACVSRLCSASIKCGVGDACEPEEAIGEAHEPEVVSFENGSLAFLEILDGVAPSRRAIYRILIDAPDRWTADPPEPVLADDAAGGVGAPSALVAADLVELYFEAGGGASIGHAVSKDGGKSFTRDPVPVLVPTEAWEAGRVTSPAAFVFGGATYIAYEGGARAGIGLARVGPSGAERVGSGPIATPATFEDPLFWRGITQVGSPYAIVTPSEPSEGTGAAPAPRDGGVVRIYLTVRGAEGSDAMTADGPIPADRNDSIGLLTTTDLGSFDRFPAGPVFARVVNLRGYLGEREPAVRLLEAGAELTFVATDPSGTEVIGLARAGAAP